MGKAAGELRPGQRVSFRLWTAKDKPTDVSLSLKGLSEALAPVERQA